VSEVFVREYALRLVLQNHAAHASERTFVRQIARKPRRWGRGRRQAAVVIQSQSRIGSGGGGGSRVGLRMDISPSRIPPRARYIHSFVELF
jgi:hypothetical protein